MLDSVSLPLEQRAKSAQLGVHLIDSFTRELTAWIRRYSSHSTQAPSLREMVRFISIMLLISSISLAGRRLQERRPHSVVAGAI